ncbi:MAG: Rpn family recombination-promoting nuclease/putative transposase [Spirochaetales bacterium]|nr:Rpn family recombination-promoting nuclease/putative transposase [Spirochaetales bacterium]
MYFLDVKTDFAFKKVFGSLENKDILISFLNALIEFPNNRVITTLDIVDPYNIPMLKGMKDTYVDVKAVLDDGSIVLIEMQILNHQGLEKRILYNVAKNYSVQLVRADDYTLLNPVIALTIVDFDMFPDSDSVITKFKLLEKESFINYADDIELIFIELPKFTKKLEDLAGIKDQWIYFIKNAGTLEYVPETLSSTVKEALNVVNEAAFTADELEIQRKRKEFIFIQKAAIEKATKDGLKKGVEQGIKNRDIAIVRSMYKEGSTLEFISKVTGLEIEFIRSITQ